MHTHSPLLYLFCRAESFRKRYESALSDDDDGGGTDGVFSRIAESNVGRYHVQKAALTSFDVLSIAWMFM